jgi:hypothetical protein
MHSILVSIHLFINSRSSGIERVLMSMSSDIASRLTVEPIAQPFQTTYFIAPKTQTKDRMGLTYAPGELQVRDLQVALTMFSHRYYIRHAVSMHGKDKLLRIYQIQKPEGTGFRIFGTLVADSDGRYLMNCVETDIPRLIAKNKEVMAAARLSLCV